MRAKKRMAMAALTMELLPLPQPKQPLRPKLKPRPKLRPPPSREQPPIMRKLRERKKLNRRSRGRDRLRRKSSSVWPTNSKNRSDSCKPKWRSNRKCRGGKWKSSKGKWPCSNSRKRRDCSHQMLTLVRC